MTQASRYFRATDFAEEEATNVGGRSTVRTARVSYELDTLGDSHNRVITNLALIQRDDGEIRDSMVKLHTLSGDVNKYLTAVGGVPRGLWAAATAYALRDVVNSDGSTYICCVAHTSGVFATDLAVPNWLLLQLGGASGAASIPFAPTATISATDVQAAIDESDTEVRALATAALAAATAGDTAIRAELANNASDLGATLIGAKLNAAGAANRTQRAKNSDWVSVLDFGVDASGTVDSFAGLQAALNASLRVDFTGATLKSSAPLVLRSGHVLIGGGSLITMTTSNTELFNAEGKSDIDISGFRMVGVSSDFSESDASRSVGVFCSGGESRIRVHHNTFTGFSYTAARFKGTTGYEFAHNYVAGPGSPTLTALTSSKCYGVLVDVGCIDGLVFGNTITKVAQGIRVEASTDTRVAFNKIHALVGQHGIYAGAALTRFIAAYNQIKDVSLIGIKVQNADYGGADSVGIVVVGNEVETCGDQGILIYNSGTAPTYKVRDVVCTDNTVLSVATNGINLTSVYGGIVSGNRIRLCTQSGVIYSECDELTIERNRIRDCVLSGIRDQLVSTNIIVRGNAITNVASGVTSGDKYGIFINNAASYVVDLNVIRDANAKMEIGVYIAAGTMSGVSVTNNTVFNATSAGARFPSPAQVLAAYFGNVWGGTIPTTNDPICPTVASVAGAMTLPQGYRVLHISGTLTTTSIPVSGHTGAVITLIYDSTAALTDGSNLTLNGNFTATANDAITLACDGLNWYEVSRSTN